MKFINIGIDYATAEEIARSVLTYLLDDVVNKSEKYFPDKEERDDVLLSILVVLKQISSKKDLENIVNEVFLGEKCGKENSSM